VALPITFLSDYGYDDEFAGVCRAVIARIAPDATVIDLTHGIAPHAVHQGAVVLARALAYAPVGVHLAVVDPGVGSERRAVAVEAGDGRLLVGPDNGLLRPAVDRLGGVVRAVDVSATPVRLDPVAATFHGRDIFAPVAAHLANGARLEDLGEAFEPEGIHALEVASRVVAHAVAVDRFGNVALDLAESDLPAAGIEREERFAATAHGRRLEGTYARAFADVPEGEPLLYRDAADAMALAVNRGSAAERLALEPGAEVVLTPA
jgi:S-adenosyl-L-methionine hydrolase (adenosine-forming)